MFLNQLTIEEKDAFMSLSVHVAKANGILEEEEKNMLKDYCKEMEVKCFDIEDIKPLEEIIAVYLRSDIHIKKIVLLESLGMVFADGVYDEKENTFINQFALSIGLSMDVVSQLTELIKNYLGILGEILKAIK